MAMTGPFSGWMRNYEAMGSTKLMDILAELKGQYGDAYGRVENKGGLLFEHIREAEACAKAKGIIGTTTAEANPNAATPAAQQGLLTDPMECSECGRVERHYADDYICRTCRDAA